MREGQSAADEAALSNLSVAFIGSAGGVVGTNDLLIQQTSTASAYVQIVTGRAYIPNLSVVEPMMYACYLDTTTSGTSGGNTNNVLIAFNNTGSTQQDYIVVYVNLSASPDAAADNVMAFADVRGTSGAAPTNAQILAVIGSNNPYIILAQIAVANGAGSGGTAISSANITDKRTYAVLNTGQTVNIPLYANFTDEGSAPSAPASGITRLFTYSGGLYSIVNGGVSAQVGNTNIIANGNAGSTPTVDWNLGSTQSYTLNANTTISFANPTPGQHYTLILAQNGTGGYTVAWGTHITYTGSTVTATANAETIIEFIYDGTTYFGFTPAVAQSSIANYAYGGSTLTGNTTSTTYVAATGTCAVTTTATTNILVSISLQVYGNPSSGFGDQIIMQITENSSGVGMANQQYVYNGNPRFNVPLTFTHLNATAGTYTYGIQFKSGAGASVTIEQGAISVFAR